MQITDEYSGGPQITPQLGGGCRVRGIQVLSQSLRKQLQELERQRACYEHDFKSRKEEVQQELVSINTIDNGTGPGRRRRRMQQNNTKHPSLTDIIDKYKVIRSDKSFINDQLRQKHDLNKHIENEADMKTRAQPHYDLHAAVPVYKYVSPCSWKLPPGRTILDEMRCALQVNSDETACDIAFKESMNTSARDFIYDLGRAGYDRVKDNKRIIRDFTKPTPKNGQASLNTPQRIMKRPQIASKDIVRSETCSPEFKCQTPSKLPKGDVERNSKLQGNVISSKSESPTLENTNKNREKSVENLTGTPGLGNSNPSKNVWKTTSMRLKFLKSESQSTTQQDKREMPYEETTKGMNSPEHDHYSGRDVDPEVKFQTLESDMELFEDADEEGRCASEKKSKTDFLWEEVRRCRYLRGYDPPNSRAPDEEINMFVFGRDENDILATKLAGHLKRDVTTP